MIENEIIQYLKDHSKGLISLQMCHAKELIAMVRKVRIYDQCHVKLHRLNHCNKAWELQRNILTTEDEINKQILLALEEKPNMDFYMYECYNDQLLFQGRIYATSPNLFD